MVWYACVCVCVCWEPSGEISAALASGRFVTIRDALSTDLAESLHAELANRDLEIGRLQAVVDKLDGDLDAGRVEMEEERERRALVEEELRMIRQSLALRETNKLQQQVWWT